LFPRINGSSREEIVRTTARRLAASLLAAALVGSIGANACLAAGVVAHRPRLAAAPVRSAGWASSNWSGYAITGTFTAVTAQWKVPSVARSKGSTYSSAWVGIDGFNNSNLIQTGTESDYYSGAAHYYAWWEILPAAETRITSMTVRPGDTMTASITKGSGSSWTITIRDTNSGGSFTTVQTYSGAGTSAEWIEEAPSIGGHVATLATYSSPDTFDPGTADGGNPRLTAADSGVMVQKHRQVSTPSVPDGDTDGFNVSYGATAPAPPSS
jgi:Peptidase A4 family